MLQIKGKANSIGRQLTGFGSCAPLQCPGSQHLVRTHVTSHEELESARNQNSLVSHAVLQRSSKSHGP
jgi:hypothetical protein